MAIAGEQQAGEVLLCAEEEAGAGSACEMKKKHAGEHRPRQYVKRRNRRGRMLASGGRNAASYASEATSVTLPKAAGHAAMNAAASAKCHRHIGNDARRPKLMVIGPTSEEEIAQHGIAR